MELGGTAYINNRISGLHRPSADQSDTTRLIAVRLMSSLLLFCHASALLGEDQLRDRSRILHRSHPFVDRTEALGRKAHHSCVAMLVNEHSAAVVWVPTSTRSMTCDRMSGCLLI
jgi:hypothetical protein